MPGKESVAHMFKCLSEATPQSLKKNFNTVIQFCHCYCVNMILHKECILKYILAYFHLKKIVTCFSLEYYHFIYRVCSTNPIVKTP